MKGHNGRRARRARQWFPVVAALALVMGVAAIVSMLAVAVVGRDDALAGTWRVSGSDSIVSVAFVDDDAYRWRVGDAGEWLTASRYTGGTGGPRFLSTAPGGVMASLSGGRIATTTEIEIVSDGGDWTLRTSPTLNKAAAPVATLTPTGSRVPWAVAVVALLALSGLAATFVTGHLARMSAGDRIVPTLLAASVIGVLFALVGSSMAMAVVGPLLLVTWVMVIVRWVHPLVPDLGVGLRAIFSGRGREEFRRVVESQDAQSRRGDDLRSVLDAVVVERSAEHGVEGKDE